MRLTRRKSNRERAGAEAPEPVPPSADPFDSLPPWFYRLAAGSLAVALILPFPPVKYALAVVLAGALVSFYSNGPHRIMLAFLLAMPALDLLPPDLIPIPGLNTETLAVFALAWAARVVYAESPRAPNTLLRPILFFCAVLAVTAVGSLFRGVLSWEEGWVQLTPWDIFASLKNRVFYMFLAPISFVLLWTPGRVRAALHAMAWCTILVSIYAIFEVRDVLLAGLTLESNRAAGLVAGQPNLFGGFLAMMIAVFTPLFLSKAATFRERLLFGATLGFGAAALLFTLSRGSWLALAAGFAVIAAFRGARLAVFLLLVAWSAQWWLPEQVVNRVQFTTEEESRSGEDQVLDDSAQVRLDQWEALPKIFADAPILGHGYRSFEELWSIYGPNRRPKAAHSTIVEIISEAGVVGLAAYVWCIGALALAGWQLSRRRESLFFADLGVGFVAAVLCLLILDSSGTRFRSGEVMAFIWVLAGASSRLARGTERPPEEKTGPRSVEPPGRTSHRGRHRSVSGRAAPPRREPPPSGSP